MMVQTGIGTYAYQQEDGVWGVPIGCLKDKKNHQQPLKKERAGDFYL